jgi:hypothetical protein
MSMRLRSSAPCGPLTWNFAADSRAGLACFACVMPNGAAATGRSADSRQSLRQTQFRLTHRGCPRAKKRIRTSALQDGASNVSQRVVLIIGGGIAAYKSLDLIRRLKERSISVRTVLTRAAEQFVTPLSVGALTNERVFTNLFDLDDEREIGHIRLARDCDLIVVAPATADLMARMAGGHADDLATAALLATNRPVLLARTLPRSAMPSS